MSDTSHDDGLTVREYARREGITIQSAYRRIWDDKVEAKQILGRWLVAAPDKEAAGAA
jgi:hypothetical protein